MTDFLLYIIGALASFALYLFTTQLLKKRSKDQQFDNIPPVDKDYWE